MSTAVDWLASDYAQLDQRRRQLDATFGPLTIPAGTSVTAHQGGTTIDDKGRVRLAERLAIRRGHATIVVTGDGIADAWGYDRLDRGPTLSELRLTKRATAQQVIDALTVHTDPACQHPDVYCRNTADHSAMIDGDERFLCATHCDCAEGDS